MYKEKTFCDLPFNKIKLWPDGNITNCCNQEKNSIGNIFEKSFEKIWFEGVINEIREHTKNKKLHKICKKFNCPFKYTLRELKDFNFELYPTHLEIDIPDSQCNIGGEDPLKTGGACLMCKRNSKFYQKEEDRLYEALEKIKYLIKYLTFIHIQGIAEPFWKDHIYNILEVLNYKYYKNKITISSLTNGILLNEKNNKKILNMCPMIIMGISIDAASNETFRKIRKVDAFDLIKNNIKNFIKNKNSTDQKIWITNNINILNVHETVAMIEMAADLGVDWVEIAPTQIANEFCKEIMVNQNNFQIFKEAELNAQQKAQDLGIPLRIFGTLTGKFDLQRTASDLVQIII